MVTSTNSFWEVCRNKNKVLPYGMAASHKECALCFGAKAFELVPCCWCNNWIHVRCSYAVPEGRACASHFDVVNPLEKQVIASKMDDVVPKERRGRSVCPNIGYPHGSQNHWERKKIRYSLGMSCMALRPFGCTNMHGVEQVSTIGRETTKFQNQKRQISHHQCTRH